MNYYVCPIISNKKLKSKYSKKLGSSNLYFDTVEITSRNKKEIKKKLVNLRDIKFLDQNEYDVVNKQIKLIIAPRKPIKLLKFNKPKIMGILNITPDSFSDGGKYASLHLSAKHANKMLQDGADIIDIGGESTRPGAITISSKEEVRRILPTINYLKDKNKKIIISLDTRKSEVMLAGIKKKIDIINDVSGLRYDKKSIQVIRQKNMPFILMHSIHTPKKMQLKIKYDDVLLDIYDFFKKKIELCEKNKINRNSIILDPGIGFGKTTQQNLKLISNIALLHSLGCPLLLGASRKSFIGKLHKNALEGKRMGGSLASVFYALSQGVQIFRVHDVFETSQAIKVFNNL